MRATTVFMVMILLLVPLIHCDEICCDFYRSSGCQRSNFQIKKCFDVSSRGDRCFLTQAVNEEVSVDGITFGERSFRVYDIVGCIGDSSSAPYGTCASNSGESAKCTVKGSNRETAAIVLGALILFFCCPCITALIITFPFSLVICYPCWIVILITILILVAIAGAY